MESNSSNSDSQSNQSSQLQPQPQPQQQPSQQLHLHHSQPIQSPSPSARPQQQSQPIQPLQQTQQTQQLHLTPNPQPQPISQPQTSTQPSCSSANTAPTVVSHLAHGARPITPGSMRPGGEYLVIIQNPRQPGVQSIRYGGPVHQLNQSAFLQGNPNIMRAQFVRATTSSASGIQAQTSQVQTTTMANMQARPITIPFSSAGQIAISSNGPTILPPITRHPMIPRGSVPNLIARGVAQQGMGVHSTMLPSSQPISLGVPTSMGQTLVYQAPNLVAPASTATAPSQMTSDDALNKGTNFFNSLLTKVPNKAKKITLQSLIQALIDGKKTPSEFALGVQKELESGPQQQLVPFLELLLPHLRHSMNTGVTQLPGIRPPNAQESFKLEEPYPSTSSPTKVQSNNSMKKKKTPLAPGQKSAWALKKEAREAKKKEKEGLNILGIKVERTDDKKDTDKNDKLVRPKPDKPRRQDKQKKQEKQLESLSSALRDDDDVNDVATMGGVNLAEESQRIMASGAELVGTQIRSCKDEPFLDEEALISRISRIVKDYNLSEPSKDVVTLVSHATQEHLKNIVERLGILAEHRSENLKYDPKYEISNDLKGQMKFLAELDRIEKRRYEEQERELLLKVAKSRSKVEDPEQQKLRQKAKDMQRAEQEEVRQREANETALLAIGPRKKLKSSVASSISSFSQSNDMKEFKNSDPDGESVRRVKRVNMRDLQVLLELDRTHLDRLVKITAQ